MNQPTLAQIKKVVAEEFGVTELDLICDRRAREAARPRQVGYLLCKQLTIHSLPAIGRAFNRDHTTVMLGIRKINKYLAADLALAVKVDCARHRLIALCNPEDT